jgi:hypothetical protein
VDAQRAWRLLLAGRDVRALEVVGPWVAIATDAGVFVWPGGSAAPLRALETAALDVFALTVAPSGELFAATADGLFVARPAFTPAAPDALHEGTNDGPLAFARTDLPEREVRGVATAGDEVWAGTPGTLWRRTPGQAFERVKTGLGDGWWELRGALRQDGRTLLAVPSGLWRASDGGLERVAVGAGAVVGIAASDGGAVVASESDVRCVDAATFPGGRPVGSAVIRATALAQASAGIAVLLDRRGISVIQCAQLASADVAAEATLAPGAIPQRDAGPLGEDPPDARPRPQRADAGLPSPSEIAFLRSAVIRHLDLAPARLRELDARARTQARWPQVRLTLGGDFARGSARSHDQTFTTGAVRDLFDASRDRDLGSDVGLQLTWDLAVAADPGFAIEISKERRELIELRDQVLERMHRLYFERVRTRLALAEATDPAAPEAVELALRERELTAALDAWSGGALSRRDAQRPSRDVPSDAR